MHVNSGDGGIMGSNSNEAHGILHLLRGCPRFPPPPTATYPTSPDEPTLRTPLPDPVSTPIMSPAALDALADHKSRRVLLIIDAQAGMLAPPPEGVPNSAAVKANVGDVLAAARDAAHPPLIVHVRNCGEPGEPDEKGTEGWELVHEPLPTEPVLDKLKNNAFAGTTLGGLVAPEDMLVVVGCQSDFCIRATCSAALGRGNDVVLIRGAHATYDRVEVLAGGGITQAKTVEREIEAELSDAGVILLDMEEVSDLFND